jgi:hypothetical protein
MSDAAIRVEACKLEKNPNITLRLAELRGHHAMTKPWGMMWKVFRRNTPAHARSRPEASHEKPLP